MVTNTLQKPSPSILPMSVDRKCVMGCGGLLTSDTFISGKPWSSKHISKSNRGKQDPHYPCVSLLNMAFFCFF